jgi:hypothetical protein
MITKYETDIRNGQIKTGDQLLLMIDSHGAEKPQFGNTHVISAGTGTATDLNNLSGSDTVSLDRIASLSRLAEEKGIQLGIVDMSCHSGLSLPLANSKTCVITSSGPETFAYGGANDDVFINRFMSNMRPGRTLEDTFLEARSTSTDMGFPMISTPEGTAVQDQLYPLLRRYLNYADTKADKFTREITDSVITRSCLQENAEVQRILELAGSVESAVEGVQFGEFRAALTAYHEYRRSLQERLDGMGVTHFNENQRVCAVGNAFCYDLTVESIMTMNLPPLLREREASIARASTPAEKLNQEQWLSYFQNVGAARDELIRKYPGIETSGTFLRNNAEINRRTSELAGKVSIEARKVYSALYQKRPAPNPCRSFVL